ncbi:hypothetical protein SAMN04489860_0323 [Paraoerskovia marina]|uniref:Uncharacterized protein n=1 Tax=Paraoerskovia marina TaxID=545619 RepID=A0A1H1MSI6_9CELL|nr:hypothetical protein [Paraoerskovia marina]SDR89668.1 hypothetical protein SAMN04489860_0323 [Paraoerskovia marina]
MTQEDEFTSQPSRQESVGVTTLLPPVDDQPQPGYAPASAERGHGIQVVVLAAATVLALVATVGVGVLWAANRSLAAEVEAAVAQTAEAQNQADAMESVLIEVPDPEALAALIDRLDVLEDRVGEPPADAGSESLQTRFQDVSRDVQRLEESAREEPTTPPQTVSSSDVESLRSEVSSLRSALGGMQQDVSTLCWALPYQDTVNASC